MNKKLIAIFTVILIFLCCLSAVSADNDSDVVSTDTVEQTTIETEPTPTETEPTEIDLSQYITVISIINGAVQFSDGYTGYSLDSSKQPATSEDGFESSGTGSAGSLSNYLKLAVVEAYKANRESDLDSIIASFVDGSYQSSSDPVIQAVLSSDETIGDNAVVKIDNTTEATFDFEVLTPVDGDTSSYFAYSVSFATVEPEPEPLSSAPVEDDNQTLTAQDDTTDDNQTLTAQDNATDDNQTLAATDNTTDDGNSVLTAQDNQSDDGKTKASDDNEPSSQQADNASDDGTQQGTTVVNQTNNTVVNKTDTTVVNQKNTTIITHHNVRTVDDTHKQPPAQDNVMRTVGNPIFILIVVFVIGSAIVVALRRRGN